MTLARTRLAVFTTGVVVLAAVASGLVLVGGPDAGRRERRDAARVSDLGAIADALVCHAESGADPEAPTEIADIAPACLGRERAADLGDPVTGAAYRIERPAPEIVSVCGDFERATPADLTERGWRGFDPATGCVSATLPGRGPTPPGR